MVKSSRIDHSLYYFVHTIKCSVVEFTDKPINFMVRTRISFQSVEVAPVFKSSFLFFPKGSRLYNLRTRLLSLKLLGTILPKLNSNTEFQQDFHTEEVRMTFSVDNCVIFFS